jgi:hypothetical protein
VLTPPMRRLYVFGIIDCCVTSQYVVTNYYALVALHNVSQDKLNYIEGIKVMYSNSNQNYREFN